MRGVVRVGIAAVIGASAVIAPSVVRAEVTELCRFDGDRLAEISGLAYSTVHDGIVWAHNDSGGGARLYAIDTGNCEIRAVLRVRGIEARDPEAIAPGRSAAGAPVLWWGDVGDNTSARRFVEVHEIPEPADLRNATVAAVSYRVRLDDRQDAEALLADGDQLWLIGKGLLGGHVWQLPRPLRPDQASRARIVGTEEALVTDAAMRPGGGYAVRDYSEVRIYSGFPPGSLESRMPLPEQVQGEAMTWTPDGTALIIASEGDDRLIQVTVASPAASRIAKRVGSADPTAIPVADVPRESDSPDPAATSPEPAVETSPPGSPTPVAAALEPVDRVGSLAVLALAIGAAVFVVSAAAVAIVARLRHRH